MIILPRLFAAALALGLGVQGAAQAAPCTGPKSATRLYVDVDNVNASQGLVAVTLYPDDSGKFLAAQGSLYVGRVPAKAGRTSVCIYVPMTGTYAVAVYHDANGNRRFDRTQIGLPAEGFGFSNNPTVVLGLPAWSSVRLAVPRSGTHTEVRLRYP